MLFLFMLVNAASASTMRHSTFGKILDKTIGNKNKAAYIQTQLAGHFTLGSASERNAVQRAQIAAIQLPSINADCGGIDIFNGGFSFINAEGMISMLKNIGSAAKGFAFHLALETVSPQIASGIKHLSKVAQDINALSMGSCEGAAALLGAVAPRHSKLHENTCKLMASHRGRSTDFVSSRTGCHERGQERAQQNANMERDLPNVMQEACNVAWYVINKNDIWKDRPDLKETLMSVTGTVITGDNRTFTILPPLALNDDFFTAFAEGGTTEIYQCTERKRCLIVTKAHRHIPILETHFSQVEALLFGIEDKIYMDQPLSVEEKNLIAETQIPILKIINIMSASQRNQAPMNIHAYAKIIANDILTKHIKDLLSITRQLANDLEGVQINAEPLKTYMRQLDIVERKLAMRDEEIHRNVDRILHIIQKTQVLEKSIHASMRTLAPGG